VILNLLNSGILEGISTWSEERGMVESREDSAEKEARRYWIDPVEAARDSSSCCSGDCAELRSLELDAPISRSRLLSSVLSPAIWKGRRRERTIGVCVVANTEILYLRGDVAFSLSADARVTACGAHAMFDVSNPK
jgi:hypothetical protein